MISDHSGPALEFLDVRNNPDEFGSLQIKIRETILNYIRLHDHFGSDKLLVMTLTLLSRNCKFPGYTRPMCADNQN